MDLNEIVSSLDRTSRSISESRHDSFDPLFRQCFRLRIIGSIRDSRRTPHIVRPSANLCGCSSRSTDPRSNTRRFASSVCELYPDLLVLGVGEFDDLGVERNMGVGPEARVLGCDSSFGDDGCGFDYGKARSSADYSAN